MSLWSIRQNPGCDTMRAVYSAHRSRFSWLCVSHLYQVVSAGSERACYDCGFTAITLQIGSRKVIRQPPPGLAVARIFPPCMVAMRRTIARPSPVPVPDSLSRRNGSNKLRRQSTNQIVQALRGQRPDNVVNLSFDATRPPIQL